MGLGLHGGGVGVAKFFVSQGADVLVTDLKNREELKESLAKLRGLPIKFVLGEHRKEDFLNADLIIKNPAVPSNSKYLKGKTPIKTDVQTFFDLFKGEIIGITGTKGKSTTATLIYKLLKKKYPKIKLAGNIGVSPLEILGKTDKVVLELSSFELEDLEKSPHIAVITNLFEDHLNRYKDFKEYINSKKSIFKHQDKDDILIISKDIKDFAKDAKAKTYTFSSPKESAVLVARLLKVPEKEIKKVLSSFKGIRHRQEFIGIKGGVKYINDTAATTPESVILALDNFEEPIILITGGENKGLDYKKLAKKIKDEKIEVILLPGTASNKLKGELKGFTEVKSMEEAVKEASSLAKKGEVVILSPGAASFNLFKNEFDRGEQFIKEYEKIT